MVLGACGAGAGVADWLQPQLHPDALSAATGAFWLPQRRHTAPAVSSLSAKLAVHSGAQDHSAISTCFVAAARKPPIDCNADDTNKEDDDGMEFLADVPGLPGSVKKEKPLDVSILQRTADSEEARGITDGPAKKALLARLGRGDSEPKGTCPPGTSDKYWELKESVTKEDAFSIEKIVERVPKKTPGKKRPPPALPPGIPDFPSRRELISGGPFPVEKRMAEIVTHVYYLWGEARQLEKAAEGTESAAMALAIERFANKAKNTSMQLSQNAKLRLASAPPGLPTLDFTTPMTSGVDSLMLGLAAPYAAEIGPKRRDFL